MQLFGGVGTRRPLRLTIQSPLELAPLSPALREPHHRPCYPAQQETACFWAREAVERVVQRTSSPHDASAS
eukprot:4256147-Amphidinium_carterae.2